MMGEVPSPGTVQGPCCHHPWFWLEKQSLGLISQQDKEKGMPTCLAGIGGVFIGLWGCRWELGCWRCTVR